MNDDDMLIIIVFLDMNMWLFRFPHLGLKSIAATLVNLRVQRVPRLIDKVVPILDEQPELIIGAPCIFTRKI